MVVEPSCHLVSSLSKILSNRGKTHRNASEDIDRVGLLDEAFADEGLGGGIGSSNIGMGEDLGELGNDVYSISLRQAIVLVIPAAWEGEASRDQGKRCEKAEELHSGRRVD